MYSEKIDSAYDEWARNHKQTATKGWGQCREAAIFAKQSEWTRVIFRAGVGTIDKPLAAVVAAMHYSRLGDITQKIGPEEFLLKAQKTNPEKFEPGFQGKPKAATARAMRAARLATKNSVALIETSMQAMLEDTRKMVREKSNLTHKQVLAEHAKIDAGGKGDLKTNNYHQARVGQVLLVLESIALYSKLSDFKANGRAWTELAGSALSLGSIACDIQYATVKSMRELSPMAKAVGVDTAADIVRGRWKMMGGVLGTGAGIAQIGLDVLNLRDEMNGKSRGFLMTIYASRLLAGVGSTLFGALAAYSYASPMLKYAARTSGKAATYEAAATIAKGLGDRRVLLLLRVARFNGIGLALTGAELAYHGYVMFIADNALEKWCLQSTFRTKKVDTSLFGFKRENTYFYNEQDEIKALETATQEVMRG
jgi:hypothetical protein